MGVEKEGQSHVKKNKGHGQLGVLLVDFLFAQTVINLLSTAAWRGVWNLWDLYLYGGADLGLEVVGLFQDEGYIDCAVGITIGTLVLVLSYIFSPALDAKLTKLSLLPYLITSRVITCTFFIFYMLMWRSWYNLGYLELTNDLRILAAFFLSTIALILLDCYSTVIGAPTVLEIDAGPAYGVLASRNPGHRSLSLARLGDSLLSTTVEVLGIVCWFGTYEYTVKYLPMITDHILLVDPEVQEVPPLVNCLVPIVCGVATNGLALLLQAMIFGRVSDSWRWPTTVLLAALGMLSSVFHWYGVWTLLDTFFLPDQWLLSNLLSAGLGFLGLSLLGVSKALHGGVGRDCTCHPPISTHYFSSWMDWYRKRDKGGQHC